ncbi:SH3 domain-containing protein [Wolbachia endosymbiont of Chironomus riparius]|uniref:SH3 domain-containing protein n=1 Tax=Wolbachia endosymbiont of Chironomus riparius TaxID=2883238 RepID=UPI0020A0815B|nr:SH3 domain-containing protein [Wolbachia endosymbiont of Chironomus riparius]
MSRFFKIFITILLFYSNDSFANNFLSIKSNKVNMRTGPGIHYPIKLIYIRKNLPLRVIEEFENWKKVCDINEDCGWIKSTLLSNKPYVMIKENTFGYAKQNIDSKVTMKIDKFAIMESKKCVKNWCLLSVLKRKSWVQKEFIWGMD